MRPPLVFLRGMYKSVPSGWTRYKEALSCMEIVVVAVSIAVPFVRQHFPLTSGRMTWALSTKFIRAKVGRPTHAGTLQFGPTHRLWWQCRNRFAFLTHEPDPFGEDSNLEPRR